MNPSVRIQTARRNGNGNGKRTSPTVSRSTR
jgi:hypothetical protein